MRVFGHPAQYWPEHPAECFVCGEAVTGASGFDGGDLRHVGEEVRVPVVPREYQAVVPDCVAAVEQALAGIPTERASDHERARVAVQALIESRFLRTSRAPATRHPARN